MVYRGPRWTGGRNNTSTVFCWKVWSRGWSLGSCAPRSYQYIPVFFMLPAISGMSKIRLPEGSVSKYVSCLYVPVNFWHVKKLSPRRQCINICCFFTGFRLFLACPKNYSRKAMYQYMFVFYMLPAIYGMSKKRLPEGSVSIYACFLHASVAIRICSRHDQKTLEVLVSLCFTVILAYSGDLGTATGPRKDIVIRRPKKIL